MITELQETQTEMLKNKMMELQSALFFTESSSIVNLPTHVISVSEVDAENQLWFAIPKPVQHINAFDKEMPAKLDFFKKGVEFFVKVRGTASLVADNALIMEAGLSDEMKVKMTEANMIAVKVVMHETELIDNTPKPAKSWLKISGSQLSSWFF